MNALQGWQCPCCRTIYAPFVQSCQCQKAQQTGPYTEKSPSILESIKKQQYERPNPADGAPRPEGYYPVG